MEKVNLSFLMVNIFKERLKMIWSKEKVFIIVRTVKRYMEFGVKIIL